MKILIGIIFTLFSLSILANEDFQTPKICYTHGQCQSDLPDLGFKCFVVKTGVKADGTTACALRCPTMPMGSYCESVVGHAWGICKKESYSIPTFDPNDCSLAIDPDEL